MHGEQSTPRRLARIENMYCPTASAASTLQQAEGKAGRCSKAR